jgi:hypothetical protein
MRGSRVALICVVAVVAGALVGAGLAAAAQHGPSAAEPGPQPTPFIGHPTGSSDLLLRWSFSGGLLAPAARLGLEPEFSLFGDGTAVVEGPPPTLPSPPPATGTPALPELVTTKLNESGIQAVLHQAGASGLFGPSRRYAAGRADQPTETFALSLGPLRRTVSFVGGTSTSEPAASPGEAAARRAFAGLGLKLGDLGSWLPAPDAGPLVVYPFDRMAVYVGTSQRVRPGETTMAWPLRTALGGVGTHSSVPGFRCAVVTGGDLADVRRVAQRASADARWRSGSLTYQVVFRPLLPDDPGC